MARVAKLEADLFANTSRFEAGMKRASKSFKGFEKTVAKGAKLAGAAIGAVTVALGALGLKQAAVIDETAKLSKALGVNIREFQALALVGSEAGISQDQFGTIITKSQRSIVEAARGLETYKRSFDTLNLSAQDLLKLSPEEQFIEIAQALVKVDNNTIRTATALEIFGRSGRQVNNILDGFVENLENARTFNDKFGVSLKGIDASKVEEANDTFARVGKAINGLGNILAIQFAPIITAISNRFLESGIDAKTFGDAVSEGMRVAGTAIDIVRASVLGLKAIFSEALIFINNFIIEATANTADFLFALRKIDLFEEQAEKGLLALRKANRSAAAAVDENRKKLEKLNIEAGKFKTISEQIAEIQKDANERLKNAPTREVTEVAINKLLEEQAAKDKKLIDLEKERIKNAKELGSTIANSFEKAVLGGEKFSDVLAGLGKDIERILFRQTVTKPLTEGITSFVSSSGIGDFIGNIFSGAPSFAVGTNRVPQDMMANIHKNEMIIPAFDAEKIRKGGGAGGGGNVSVIVNNNSNAKVSTSTREGSGGTELTLMIDQAVADNMSTPGSRTNQAMGAFTNRSLLRR